MSGIVDLAAAVATSPEATEPPASGGVLEDGSGTMTDGMPHQMAGIVRGHATMRAQLWLRLRAISERELDWRIHEHTNTVRSILSQLLFVEEWTADMLEDAGTYRTNRDPKRYPTRDLEALRSEYEAAFVRTQANLREIRTEDLDRQVDMLGVMTVPLLPVLENHVPHIAGHVYQIRLIRGTYAREHGTDKSAFDEW